MESNSVTVPPSSTTTMAAQVSQSEVETAIFSNSSTEPTEEFLPTTSIESNSTELTPDCSSNKQNVNTQSPAYDMKYIITIAVLTNVFTSFLVGALGVVFSDSK